MLLPVVLALTLAQPPQDPQWTRDRIIQQLEELIRTGEPRHVGHDEGQELWKALQPLLHQQADQELRWLATRAAYPIVASLLHLLPADNTGVPMLEIRASRVLPLPWPVSYSARIEGSLDGGDWQPLADIRSGTNDVWRLDDVLQSEGMTPGLHHLRLRVRISYVLADGGTARELRPLSQIPFGLWDGYGAEPRGPLTMAIRRARAAAISMLHPGLPGISLEEWLGRWDHHVLWRTAWCDQHATRLREGAISPALCLVGIGSAGRERRGRSSELWIRIGELRADEEVSWVEEPPALIGSYLFEGETRTAVPLSMLDVLADKPTGSWPGPELVVHASDIVARPAVPRPGTPTDVRVVIRNPGPVDAIGVQVNVLAGSGETRSGKGAYVRDIPAGGHVEIVIPITFPESYGWIEVWPLLLSDHFEWSPPSDPNPEPVFVWINRAGTPSDIVDAMCRRGHGRVPCGR